MQPLYTAIWQSEDVLHRQWVEEIFGPYIDRHVLDGKRELVLDNAILFDSFIYCHDPAYYARFKGTNAFLVHFLDEFYEGGDYAAYKNFRGVFRNFWSSVFNPELVTILPLGYTNGTRLRGIIRPATSRQFVWAMLGQCNKSSRPDAARALSRIEPHFFGPTDSLPGFGVSTSAGLGKKEYQRILLNAMFVPCPMGNANIESYRTFEALESGAIPIVEKRPTLDYYHALLGSDFPAPTVSNWREARVIIADLIKHPAELTELQQRCIRWWMSFKNSYSDQVGMFLERRSAAEDGALDPLSSWRTSLPLWRELELIRHHSGKALFRRIFRQVSRLIWQGRWRVAFRSNARHV